MIDLPQVTMVNVDGRDTDEVVGPMLYSMQGISFGKAKLLSTSKPADLDSRIEHVEIQPLKNLAEYSLFIRKQLNDHIDTTHCLIMQADGFVINPELWNPDYLGYDYIGAPWPLVYSVAGYRMGNGGFSLRSKKLLAEMQLSSIESEVSEDVYTCRHYKAFFMARGLRYAPNDLAATFSVEFDTEFARFTPDTCFGFHNWYGKEEIRKRLNTFTSRLKKS